MNALSIAMNRYVIPNLKHACRVITLLSEEAKPMSIAELSKRLEVPRTSMLRIIKTLEAEGMVEAEGRCYVAGAMLLRAGLMALKQSHLRVLAGPVLDKLAVETRETAHIAKMAGQKMLILEVSDSPNTVRAASQAGTLADLHCSATGKVMLAYTVENLAAFFRELPMAQRTEHTITNMEAFEAEIEQTRERGYGLDDVEYVVGVRCLAAPVYSALGDVVAAIGITASIMTFTRSKIEFMAERVQAAAAELSVAMGYEPK